MNAREARFVGVAEEGTEEGTELTLVGPVFSSSAAGSGSGRSEVASLITAVGMGASSAQIRAHRS